MKPTLEQLKARYGENWGLSPHGEPAKPVPAPTSAELAAHYARHDLEFKPKAQPERETAE